MCICVNISATLTCICRWAVLHFKERKKRKGNEDNVEDGGGGRRRIIEAVHVLVFLSRLWQTCFLIEEKDSKKTNQNSFEFRNEFAAVVCVGFVKIFYSYYLKL